jgi:general secretion pathway protein K
VRLLEALQLDPSLAQAVLDWIDADGDLAGPGGAEDAWYLALARPYRAANQALAQVEELYRVRGFDARAVARLRPFVSALPGRVPVNANTASAEVLAALLPELTREEARALADSRKSRPFKDKADLAARAKSAAPSTLDARLDVKSDHFLVQVAVTQDDVQVALEALVRRGAPGASPPTAIIWRRALY